MNDIRKDRPCGRRECTCSRHRDLFRTFGYGHLKDGLWEYPCRVCAIAADEMADDVIAEARAHLAKMGRSHDEIEEYIEKAAWLHNPAWPFADGVEVEGFGASGAQGFTTLAVAE